MQTFIINSQGFLDDSINFSATSDYWIHNIYCCGLYVFQWEPEINADTVIAPSKWRVVFCLSLLAGLYFWQFKWKRPKASNQLCATRMCYFHQAKLALCNWFRLRALEFVADFAILFEHLRNNCYAVLEDMDFQVSLRSNAEKTNFGWYDTQPEGRIR